MNPWLWAILVCVIAVLAVVEFTLLARRPRVLAPAEALAGTGLWIVAAGLFARVIYVVYEKNWFGIETIFSLPMPSTEVDATTALVQFITVYVAETALSLDNIAVLSLLLTFYKVPQALVPRVLFWAVTVSLVMRLALIAALGPLSLSVQWIHYLFAGLLLLAVARTLLLPDAGDDVGRGVIPRLIARIVPVAPEPDGTRLTTRVTDASGRSRLALTPLTAVVLVIAIADFTYAADFLPAAYSITRDPFIAFAGNAFALLTLRSLYFTIAPFMGRFRYLKLSLVFIMLYIVVNTLFFHQERRPAEWTLGVVCGVLCAGVIASVLVNKRKGLPTLPLGAVLGADAPPEVLAADLRPAPIDDLREAALSTKRNFRKVCILIAGTCVILLGILIAPLPGPGFVIVAPIGVAILATEFIWAKRLMDRLKQGGDMLTRTTDRWSARIPAWVMATGAVVWPFFWAGLWWLLSSGGHVRLASVAIAAGVGLSFPLGVWVWRKLFRKPG